MSHHRGDKPRHRRRIPNDLQAIATAVVCALLAATAIVLWVSRDEPAAGMLTPVQISQIRNDRIDQLNGEDWSAIHAPTRDRTDPQQAR